MFGLLDLYSSSLSSSIPFVWQDKRKEGRKDQASKTRKPLERKKHSSVYQDKYCWKREKKKTDCQWRTQETILLSCYRHRKECIPESNPCLPSSFSLPPPSFPFQTFINVSRSDEFILDSSLERRKEYLCSSCLSWRRKTTWRQTAFS